MRRFALALAVATTVSLGPAHAQVAGQVPGKWVKLAPFLEPAEELYGTAAAGKLYVFGGLAPGCIPRGLVFEYSDAHDAVEFGAQ